MWSTRELADLAGVTLKTVRHYHSVGLLPEPSRNGSGYKQYGTEHLLRLLEIKRMRRLGFSLADLRRGAGADTAERYIVRLEEELEQTIVRLEQIRGELREIKSQSLGFEMPIKYAEATKDMSRFERILVLVSLQLFVPEVTDQIISQLRQTAELNRDFDVLSAAASASEIEAMASRIAVQMSELQGESVPIVATDEHALRGSEYARRILHQIFSDLFNPAQIRAAQRAQEIFDRRNFEGEG